MDSSVPLDVGGTFYRVARDTIEHHGDSMLSRIVSTHSNENGAENAPIIFIEGNGRLFEYVLDYMRTGKVYLPPSVTRAAMKKEFDSYGIPADMNKVVEKHGNEYARDLAARIEAKQKELDLLRAEVFAFQLSHLLEFQALASRHTGPPFCLYVMDNDYPPCCKNNQDLLRQQLASIGLDLVSSMQSGQNQHCITVEYADMQS
ncbi:hypothetical protein FisN_14Hu041 [Fistulifera solaris]|uniref:BTB domain-containing protein n=1 Tax=Fistulifera solaris TaxID=1519565 RepID=A0A1Z5K869_FISSO|nr:hypothetical protein FisN_14Hu041 [Fistulifera solaris]|eukprot:GAX22427.1 hypothetical protein FisN_14Hu041 [Fistulifera solaris]